MADAGYDVADYRDIEPLFGTLADAGKWDKLWSELFLNGAKVKKGE